MATESAIGFYGKLPCNGDFLQRRVPAQFVEAWDAWLQECLHASRQQLGERWLDAYLTSPVWRFVLAQGVCHGGAYAGVMLPSVDRVGRYFPLTIVAQLAIETSPLQLACSAAAWFDAAETVGVAALQATELDLLGFDAEVVALSQQLTAPSAEADALRERMRGSDLTHSPQWHLPLTAASAVPLAVTAFASCELEQRLRPLAIWWTEGSQQIEPSLLCTRGLPDPGTFVAMLAGHFGRVGWLSLQPEAPDAIERASPQDPAPLANFTAPPAVLDGLQAIIDAPRLDLIAWHEPVARAPGTEPTALFVERPELGLWAIVSRDAAAAAAGMQLLADVLQSVPLADSLTALVEEVRRSLDRAQGQLARAGTGATGALVFLTRGAECALVRTGALAAARLRDRSASLVLGAPEAALPEPDAADASPEDGSLMALLATPRTCESALAFQYDALRAGDVWLLSEAGLFEDAQHAALARAWSSEDLLSGSVLAMAREVLGSAAGRHATLPLLVIAARASRGSAA